MIKDIFNFIFNNAIFAIIIGIVYYIYRQYKVLKEKDALIKQAFETRLSPYLDQKITEAARIANEINKEYGHVELIRQEIERLGYSIEKGVNGTINDKIDTSNLLNKFKLNKKIDINRYPNLKELEKIGTFTEEEMNSVDNGLALTRKEYNAEAFRYNEKANEFPIEYLKKYLGLVDHYGIFDAVKTSTYDEDFEVFEEKEPEINSLSSLNLVEEVELPKEKEDQTTKEEPVVIEKTDAVFKPSTSIMDNK